MAVGIVGDPEGGPIWRCWWCTRAVVGPSGVRLRVPVGHFVPIGRSIDGFGQLWLYTTKYELLGVLYQQHLSTYSSKSVYEAHKGLRGGVGLFR